MTALSFFIIIAIVVLIVEKYSFLLFLDTNENVKTKREFWLLLLIPYWGVGKYIYENYRRIGENESK